MESSSSLTQDCIRCMRKALSRETFASDCSDGRDLCENLSDGEILCNALSEFSRGRVSFDSALVYSTNSHLLARKNVKFFLKQCREVYELEEHELFEPDDLLTLRNPEKVLKTILRLFGGAGSSEAEEAPGASASGSDLMANLIKEICCHEQALVDKLSKLLVYRNELQGLLSEWPTDLVDCVFKHTEQLYAIHTEFHAKLTNLAGQGCEQFCHQLNALFGDMKPKLEIYCEYFSHLPTANSQMLAAFKTTAELAKQLYLLENWLGGLPFRGLFDAPIRQTSNYQQLFGRLAKIAEQELPDAAGCVAEAAKEAEILVNRANSFKRHVEQLEATKEILAQVSGLPLELGRPEDVGLHLADDCFKVKVVRNQRTDLPHCFCILTTKQLIVASKPPKRSSGFAFALSVEISSSLEVKKSDKSGCLEIVEESGDRVILEDLKHRSCVVEKWLKLMQDNKAANFPEGWDVKSHSFKLATLPAGALCSMCQLPIIGVVMQGYSCLHCSKQLHLDCLTQLTRELASNYYHRKLDRKGAEALLAGRQIGAFLLRDSTKGGKALSLKSNRKIEHINIVEESDGRCALGNSVFWLKDIDELLNYYRANCLSIHFKDIICKLGDGVLADTVQTEQL